MNIKDIKALAEIMNECGLTALEINENGENIRLERNVAIAASIPQTVAPASIPAAVAECNSCSEETTIKAHSGPKYKEIKSPMVGVFYSSSVPGGEPFVKEGDLVRKGDVLCIIEAMKLMNEYTAEIDGEIAEVCVENGQLLEYGQCMFKLK